MNYYPNMYNNVFQNPYLQSPYQTKTEITKVNGKNGAEAFQLAPNSSVLLLDEVNPIVWLKTTDGAGYPTITPYSITPYKETVTQENDFSQLEQRIIRLEGIINESYINTKQHISNDAPNQSVKNDASRSPKSTNNSRGANEK